MLKYIFIALIYIIEAVSTRDVIFSVIGFGNSMQVIVENKTYNLTNKNANEPYYQAKILNINDSDVEYVFLYLVYKLLILLNQLFI